MNKKLLWLGVLLCGISIRASAQSPIRTVKGGALAIEHGGITAMDTLQELFED